MMWGRATEQKIIQRSTPSDGWSMKDGTYEITWFKGQQLPETLIPSHEDEDEESCADGISDDCNLPSDDEAEVLSSEED